MIQVSNEFKKAIKKPERRIKGYVEVLYDLPEMNITSYDSYTISPYTSISELNNGNRVANLYGSIDYLPLDGSYLVMSETNENSGVISSDLFENIPLPEIVIFFDEAIVKGITLYFRTNIPTSISIACSDGTETTVENHKECVQIIFDEPKTISSLAIDINDVMYPDRKIYLNEIDLGITQVYKDQNLIDFTVDEEVNKLVEETPINETNITLNNMSDLFNPLNPTGIVPYLSENTLIKPYIGVLTENLGVEYVKMGEFYFDSYTNNSDATTTLVGKNILKQVEKEVLKDDNEFNVFKSIWNKSNFEEFMENYEYNFKTIDYNPILATFNINKEQLIDLIKEMSFFNSTLFYADRDNKLNLKNINSKINDTISKTELINDAEYKKIEKINTLIYTSPSGYSTENVTSRVVYESDFTLETSPQYVLCKSESPSLYDATLTQTGASSASIITKGYYLCFVKLTGTIGSTVNIKLNSTTDTKESIVSVKTTTKSQNEKENIIEFNTKLKRGINTINTLMYAPSYEMKFEYNGDPSLEAGDYINVETPYGYKKLFIQKNRFKFDGGLEGSIEGVE